jgi:beta-lactamase regulating signal transducer with metallopeptidase domain
MIFADYVAFISFALRLAVNLTLIGAPVAVGIVIAFRLSRAGAPRIRYLIAVLSFFMAAALPVAITWGALTWRDPGTVFSVEGSRDANRGVEAKPGNRTGVLPLETVRAVHPSPSAARLDDFILWFAGGRWGSGLFVLWLTLTVLLLVREVMGHVLLRRARREWEPATMQLCRELAWPDDIPLFVHHHDGPATVGLLRLAVVLPARLLKEFSTEATRRIAAHELAHARWRDPMVNALLRLICAFLWPSLPLWVLLRIIRTEREAAADRMAIGHSAAATSRSDVAADYAESLVVVAKWSGRTARSRYFAWAATSAGSGVILEERVHRLLASVHQSRGRMLAAIAVVMVFLISTGFLPVVSNSQANEEQRGAAAMKRIATILSDLPDGEKKTRIFQSLDAMNRLFAGLKGGSWDLKGETAAALDQIRQGGLIDALLLGLRDEDEMIKEKSAWAVGQLEDRRSVGPLINSLSHNSPRVRQTAAWALGMVGDARAVAPLILRLKKDDWPNVRQSSAWALGKIGNPQAVEPLITSLTDDWPDVRHGSAWALGMIGDVRAVEALRVLANEDRDEDVRQIAESALAQLSNR